jgi:aminopeptidase N
MLLTVLAIALGSVSPGSDSLMAPGVSRTLAEERAKSIADVRYELLLDVTDRDTATGRVSIRFHLRRRSEVILDFRGLRLGRMRVNGNLVSQTEWNGHHVRIPAAVLASGANRVEADFAALIAPSGASIIRVGDPADGSSYIYTLLVPSDAQQLFPCFDQPDLKARVSFTLITPLGWRAVANGELLRADSSSRGTTFSFAETQPLSTYLVAFAAGPWTVLSGGPPGRQMALYVRRSRASEVDADSIFAAAARALDWLAEYFAIPYPFGKMDLVLAPAFPFGGMEHPGAVFFAEERFIFREQPTLTQRLGRLATVYHEMAHQWFGDLVTMRWFDDLWLKEGFATYMATKMQAAMDQGEQAWKTFYLRNKPAAYAVDASAGTTPIWQELDNLDRAKSNYGAIVYNKAPAVLKQLEYLVGERAFRSGLQTFLRRHAFANASWRDLLSALGAASGRDLRSWGERYILQPGLPVLEQELELRAGRLTRLTLVQRAARAELSPLLWPIRTEVLVVPREGRSLRIAVEISGRRTVVTRATGLGEPLLVYGNAGDHAYAIVRLDPRSVATLERALGTVEDAFLRALLWGALWDLVRDAVLDPVRYVRLALRQLPRENDEEIVASVLAHLTRASNLYLGKVGRAANVPDVERYLLAAAADSGRSYGIRRAHFDAFLRVAASPAALDTLAQLAKAESLNGLPLGHPTRWSIVTRLLAQGYPGAEQLLARQTARDSSPEGKRRAFVAAAAVPDSATKARYFWRYFADSSLNEEWASSSLDAFNNMEAEALTLPFIRPALDSLPWIQIHRRIFYLGSWLSAFIENRTSRAAHDTVRSYLESRRSLSSDLRSKILQSLDELERTITIRERFGDG